MPTQAHQAALASRPPLHATNAQTSVDFNIHGLVRIRLIDPSRAHVAAVSKQLGLRPTSTMGEPDIGIRFVEYLPVRRLRFLGANQKGFTDDDFFVFESRKRKAKVKIPFDRIGEQCEIVCESTVLSVPLLMPILGVTALKKGCVPLHASAFVQDGVGIVVAGWANCGKTTTLLGFVSKGAEYIGDDWVLLSRDGQRMYGLATTLELSHRHLACLPRAGREVGQAKRLALGSSGALNRLEKLIPDAKSEYSLASKGLQKVLKALEHRLRVAVAPSAIFGGRLGSLVARPDKFFLLLSQNDTHLSVEPTPPLKMARRLALSTQHELISLMEHYLAHQFAFPETPNALLDSLVESQFEILSHALEGKEAYIVRHPHPLVFADLYEKLQPYCQPRGDCAC